MKKTFIVLAAMLVTSIAAKAWEVGDYYDLDGVPSIVVWVDSTGEHGLRMSPKAHSETVEPKSNAFYKDDGLSCGVFKKNVFTGDIVIFATSKKKKEEAKERWDKYHERYEEIVAWQNANLWNKKNAEVPISVEKLFQSNCEYGEINMKAVIAFCENNNIDMETYFPSYYWATNIGNSWFIPGAHEANLISKMITNGLGTTQGHYTVEDNLREYHSKIGGKYFTFVFDIAKLLSSTFILSDWAQDSANEEMLGFVEAPNSEKKGGWYDYKKLYEENAREYYGAESGISLVLERLQYNPPLNTNMDKFVDYYLLMRNEVAENIYAVSYF